MRDPPRTFQCRLHSTANSYTTVAEAPWTQDCHTPALAGRPLARRCCSARFVLMQPGMTKQLFMIPACLPFLTALGAGCAVASDAVDDAVTVEVGAESLQAVEMDRSITLDGARIPDCLDFDATVPLTNTTVMLRKSPGGCTLAVQQPDLVLLDEHAIDRAREKAGNFDVDGIRSCTLELQRFDLSTANGAALALAEYLDGITLIIDGEVVLDHVSASELQAAALARRLPARLMEKLKTAVKANQAAVADVEFSLWLRAPVDLPDTLDMHVVMQPTLQVNVIDAAL